MKRNSKWQSQRPILYLMSMLCLILLGLGSCNLPNPEDPDKDPNKEGQKDPDEEFTPVERDTTQEKEREERMYAITLSVTEIQASIDYGDYQVEVETGSSWEVDCDKEWVRPYKQDYKSLAVSVIIGLEMDTATVRVYNERRSATILVYRVAPPANGGFSIAPDRQVVWAPGNLQYQFSTDSLRFAEHQYDTQRYQNDLDERNLNTKSEWIDLFGWGTGDNPGKYDFDEDYSTYVDWGINEIDSYPANTWRLPSLEEWQYIFDRRVGAQLLQAPATVNGHTGILVLPDNTLPIMHYESRVKGYDKNVYTEAEWAEWEKVGAVFLPACGYRSEFSFWIDEVHTTGGNGYYWTSTPAEDNEAYYIYIGPSIVNVGGIIKETRAAGFAVRLVRDLRTTR